MFLNDFKIFYMVEEEKKVKEYKDILDNIIKPCFSILGKGTITVLEEDSKVILLFKDNNNKGFECSFLGKTEEMEHGYITTYTNKPELVFEYRLESWNYKIIFRW